MAKFDITEIQETKITTDLAGKIIGITGGNNTGKSYVSARLFPGQTLWLATEKGYNAQGGLRPYDIETWGDFRDAVAQLTTRNKAKREKVREMYKCVVVDVADKLPDLTSQYIITKYNDKHSEDDGYTPITSIGDIPYGGGYGETRKELDTQITKLSLSGYCVVLIFHEEIRKPFGSNNKEDEYIVPKNTFTKAGSVLKDIPDWMIYLEGQGVDENGKAVLSIGHCVQHKEFFARCRFTECPEVIAPFTVDNLKENVRIACEREAEKNGVGTMSYDEEVAIREKTKKAKTNTREDLVEMLTPVIKILMNDKQGKNFVKATIEQYLGVDEEGKMIKITNEDNSVDALQYIYNTLVDYADEKGIDWE